MRSNPGARYAFPINLSSFYARAAADIPDADKLITDIIKAHDFAQKEGLLPLQMCASNYHHELAFFLARIDLPSATFSEIASIRFAQVSCYAAALTRHLVAFRAAKGIIRAEDIFSLLAVLRVILGKDELDLELEPAGEELDTTLWKGAEVLHFSDLMQIEDRPFQMMLKEVLWETSALAFSRTSPELRERILSQCSGSARSDLQLRMYIGGSEEKCRLAQGKWLEKLGRMIDAGEVEI